jgi:hypothetical protein
MREKRVVLKDRAHIAPVRRATGHRFSIEQYFSGSRLLESGDEPKGGGFAATGGTNQGEKLALTNGHRHIVDNAVRRVVLRKCAQLEYAFHRGPKTVMLAQ